MRSRPSRPMPPAGPMPDDGAAEPTIRLEWPGRPALAAPPPPGAGPPLTTIERWPGEMAAATGDDGSSGPGTATLIGADAIDVIDEWRRNGGLSGIPGRPRLIYLDPPFATGDAFAALIPVGPRRPDQPTVRLPAYRDTWAAGLAGYLTTMAGLLSRAHDLLAPDGWLCVHVDHRASAHLRLLLDEIFRPDAFRNEIVWSYGLGNAVARDRFPRKHDTLLLYARTPAAPFVPVRGAVTPAMERKYRHVRPDGTRFMRSYGREYDLRGGRPAGSVWSDIPALAPTSAERTSYPTQKPLALLSRLIAATTAVGDLVLDPCCGSGTTALAAALAGRTGIGIDRSALAIATARARVARAGIPFTVRSTDQVSGNPIRGGVTGSPPRRYHLDATARIIDGRIHIALHGLRVDPARESGPPAGEPGRYVVVSGGLLDRRDRTQAPLTMSWSDWLEGWAVIAGADATRIGAGAFRTSRPRDLVLDLTIPIGVATDPAAVTIRLFDLFGASSDHVVPVTPR